MRGIWFFDDWMLERRDCLERVWGKPTFVKEIFSEFYPDGWDGYGGYPTAFYDERLGKYALYLIAFPGRESRDRTPGISAGEFQFRLIVRRPLQLAQPGSTILHLARPGAVLTMWSSTRMARRSGRTLCIRWRGRRWRSGDTLRRCWMCRGILPGAGSRMTVYVFRWTVPGPWLDPGSDIAGDILWNHEAGSLPAFCASGLR